MFCNKCGNKIEDGAAFCVMCGSALGLNNMYMNQKVKTKKKRKWPIIVIAICLISIVVSIFSTVYVNKTAPVNVVKNYLKAVEEKDFDKASKCYHSKINKITKSEFEVVLKGFENAKFTVGKRVNFNKDDLEEIKKYIKEEYNVNISDACMVKVTINKRGEKIKTNQIVIKVDGKWYFY